MIKTFSPLLLERNELAMDKLNSIVNGTTGNIRLDSFKDIAIFLCQASIIAKKASEGGLDNTDVSELKKYHDSFYKVMSPEKYSDSVLNPEYAVSVFEEQLGGLISAIFADATCVWGYAYEGRLDVVTIFMELIIQVYCILDDTDEDKWKASDIKDAYYWFMHDYSEIFMSENILGMIDDSNRFFTGIIESVEVGQDLAYLYRIGQPISGNEIKMAQHLNSLSHEEIAAMAHTYVEGFRKGFETTGKDISIKDTVQIYYPVGMELVVKEAIRQFDELGLTVTIKRESAMSLLGRGGRKAGCYSTSVNKQFDFDHKDDMAYYLDKAMVDRLLEVKRVTFEHNEDKARRYGGPAVIEVFGEEPFEPVNKKEAAKYTDKQNAIKVEYMSKSGIMTNQFIPGDEYSFTIIAFPIPAIGDNFKEIFDKTVEINNLDYEKYKRIQQCIIDVLDQGEKVHITGRGDNLTDIYVALQHLEDPSKQTDFENCVADVNIPVGEVFTSPELDGTTGVLHVTSVYLNDLNYKNIKLTFEDGVITDYTCTNFENEQDNKDYIFNNVLFKHETLPMGEFAIGTNTTAYKMGLDYGISARLPILIAEKTGPHFAVGDTCYSHSEEVPMMNPDGKECIARENKFSRLRDEDMSKAYFNCHTDITIPYSELGDIDVHCADGRILPVIKEGRFVVPGTEELNEVL